MSVTNSLPCGGRHFPFSVEDPETGKDVNLDIPEDVHALFNTWGGDGGKWPERRFVYSQMCGIDDFLVERSFQDVLKRIYYCVKFNVPPFKGAYDDQPKWWSDAMSIVDNAEREATNYMRRKNG